MGLRHRSRFADCHCFFVTSVCKDHLSLLRPDNRKHILAESLNFIQTKYRIHVVGYVLMPNHFHLILYFPESNCLSACMRDLKKYTSYKIRQDVENTDAHLFRKLHFPYRQQLFKVWEDRFDDVWLGGREILETKLDYIHNNPLQAQWSLCELPEDYVFSSAGFYNKQINGFVQITDYREFF